MRDKARAVEVSKLLCCFFPGIFSFLYIVPATALVACYFYEYRHLPDWTQMWQEDVCRDPIFRKKWQTHCRFPDGQGPDVAPPDLNVFLAKYFAVLVIGIVSGFWVWCSKTLSTWRAFFWRLVGRKGPPQAYV